MFSRWNFARLKVAEKALNDGRVDEAYERLLMPGVKNLRRAQELLDTFLLGLPFSAVISLQPEMAR